MIIFLINAVFFKLKLPSLIFVGARGVSKQIKFNTGEPRLTASPVIRSSVFERRAERPYIFLSKNSFHRTAICSFKKRCGYFIR